jgi:hypothetical protein
VSWYVLMGIGQVVTLRVPPERLREINRIVEEKAWGAFSTEFYATYDFRPVWDKLREERRTQHGASQPSEKLAGSVAVTPDSPTTRRGRRAGDGS